jgi:DNA-binding NtrC family response regulator
MHFLRNKINSRSGKLYSITRKALDVLTTHDWPGNVRELENAIERACALCDDSTIRVADLPPLLRGNASAEGGEEVVETPEEIAAPEVGLAVGATGLPTQASFAQPIGSLKDYLRDQELTYVNRALAQTAGDKEKAAEMLGVSVATLYRKLAEEEAPRLTA